MIDKKKTESFVYRHKSQESHKNVNVPIVLE